MYTPAKKYRAISGREMWETWGAGSENLSQPHPADRVIGWSVAISTSDVLPLPILIPSLPRTNPEGPKMLGEDTTCLH